MKTLVVVPNWIGDALMAQPLLALLKAAGPGETIVALAPRWVAPVVRAMPEVDETIATELAHGRLQWSDRLRLARDLRARRFDRAFVLPNSFKSALVPWLARIPTRIGYRGESRFVLVGRRVDGPDPSLAMRERYAALATAIGIDVREPLPRPRLAVDDAAIARVRTRFGFAAGDVLIALCPGAEYGPAKRWPAAHFAALATTLLVGRPDAHVVLVGGPGDRPACDAIAAAVSRSMRPSPRFHDLAGRTDLDEALALIATASEVVSNDSGLMHVAAALDRPQVALFGSSDPRHTPPLSDRASVLWLHLDCSPCFARVCPLGHLNCLVGIAPGRVVESMQNNDPRSRAEPANRPRWSS